MKKSGVGGKTEFAKAGKNAKVGSSFPTGGRLLSVSAGKTSTAPSFKTGKSQKSSTFGVIWIPRRKNKYHKDTVYNSHKDDRSYARAPSMYN